MRYGFVLLSVLSVLLCGCGVKFVDTGVDAPIPKELDSRAVYSNGIAVYAIEDLVGSVLTVEPGEDPILCDYILPADFVAKAIAIQTPMYSYESNITAGFKADGKYVTFSADLDAKTVVQLKLFDSVRAGIVFAANVGAWDQVKAKMFKWVAEHPKTNPDSTRLWVKTVVLVSKSSTVYRAVTANSSVLGTALQVKGSVYGSDKKTEMSTIITLEAVDMDKVYSTAVLGLGVQPGVTALSTLPTVRDLGSNVLEEARFSGAIKGVIRKLK